MKDCTWLTPILWWLYSALAVTGLCALVSVAVQQDLRQGANDPQIQMAEDAAAGLAQGEVPAALAPRGATLVDIKNSLSPWLAIYDSAGKPLENSGQLNNEPPQLPVGLFNTSTWLPNKTYVINGMQETRVTWQPQTDVRQAVVLVKVQSGSGAAYYVAAGRSLREVENRESQLNFEVTVLWAATLASLFVAIFAGWWIVK